MAIALFQVEQQQMLRRSCAMRPSACSRGTSTRSGKSFSCSTGTFSDEHGDYPAGTYVRNPPGSRHSPCTGPGRTILVKLRQMPPMERRRIVVDAAKSDWEPGDVEGHARLGLYFVSPRGERVTPAVGSHVELGRVPAAPATRGHHGPG
jgi:hypothetical protein